MSLINQMLRDLEARHSKEAKTHDPTHINAPTQSPCPRATGAKRTGVALMGFILLGCGMGAGWYLAQSDTSEDVIQAEMVATQRIPVAEKPGAEVPNAREVADVQAQNFQAQAGSEVHKTAAPPPLPEAEPQGKTALGAKTDATPGKDIKTELESTQPARSTAPSPPITEPHATARTSAPEEHPGRISFKPSANPLEQRQRVLGQAQQLYSRGDYPAAIATLHHHLEQDAGDSATASAQIIAVDARIYRQLALAQLRLNKKAEAITTLEQGHIRAPEDIALHILYARILMEEEQHQRAYTMLRDLPQPHLAAQPDFYALRAALARQLGIYTEAIQLYTLLCDLQPLRGDWRLGLAISQHQNGDLGQARANYQRAAANTRLDTQLRNFAAHQAQHIQTSKIEGN
jgi:MSHA biogenesis protein MshN